MNAFTTLLAALALAGLVIVLTNLFGMKMNDPKKVPLSSCMGLVEKKYRDVSGASINAYPAIILRDEDGTSRKLRLKNWAIYEDLWVGDRVQVNHRDWWAEEVLIQERGDNYRAAQTVRSAPARFLRSYVNNTSFYRHTLYAEFVTDEGETLSLRPPSGWPTPAKNTPGRLTWHGEQLDEWSET